MHVKLINCWDELETLAGEWNGLLSNSTANTIFLTWEWITAWKNTLGNKYTPFVITVRTDDDELAGIAPFYLAHLYLFKFVPYNSLRVLGDLDTGSEYPNLIIKKGLEDSVYTSFFKTLEEHRKKWDCIWMPNWAGWSSGAEQFLAHLNENEALSYYKRERDFSFFTLSDSVETLFSSMSKSRRYANRRILKKISALPDIEINHCSDQEELSDYLETLFDLHRKRWGAQGEKGSFTRRPALKQFYKEFTPKALEKGWLKLLQLEENGHPKAIQIGYTYNNVYHQMQEGFDPSYADGVGNYLRIKFIEQCIADNAAEYDFLGGYSEHKRRWGAVRRTGYDFFIWNKNLKNILFTYKQIWPTGRYLESKASY